MFKWENPSVPLRRIDTAQYALELSSIDKCYTQYKSVILSTTAGYIRFAKTDKYLLFFPFSTCKHTKWNNVHFISNECADNVSQIACHRCGGWATGGSHRRRRATSGPPVVCYLGCYLPEYTCVYSLYVAMQQ